MRKLHLGQVVQTLKHQLVLRVLYLIQYNPNVIEVWLTVLLQHVVQAVVAPMLLKVRTEIDDLLAEGILIIGDAAAVPRIHDGEKVIEVVVLLALILIEIEFVID